jgi:hypothetical protein
MKKTIGTLAITAAIAMAGCSGDAGQMTELQDKLSEQTKALTDTVGYYTGMIDDLQFQVDSLQAELAKLSGAVSGGGTSSKPAPPPPPKPSGSVDVSKKGTGEGDVKVDVSKKGSEETQPKVDVSKKGKGGGR